MNLRTLGRYLLGDREAILEVANNPWSLRVGCLFVISAAFARDYDGQDLLHEPWHLLIPLAASTAAAAALYALVFCLIWAIKMKSPPDDARFFRAIVALFWMTAPLAWLYAVPYERFVNPVQAVQANLCTLAIVAAWRVLLITRALAVLLDVKFISVFFVVMLFADAMLLLAASVAPAPIIEFMGGVRVTEPDDVLQAARIAIFELGIMSAPVWLIGAVLDARFIDPAWPSSRPSESIDLPVGVMRTAIASVVIWFPILAWTLPEQVLRSRTERLFASGEIDRGVSEMSAHDENDYPPHWDPPPRVGWAEWKRESTMFEAVCASAERVDAAPWVNRVYARKVEAWLRENEFANLGADWPTIAQAIEVDALGWARSRKCSNELRFVSMHHAGVSAEEGAALERVRQRGELDRLNVVSHDMNTTALMFEVTRMGDVAALQAFLEQGADIHVMGETKETLLTVAALAGKADAVRWLISVGGDPCARGSRGETLLITAARSGDIGTVRAVLELAPCVELDAVNEIGQSALLWARMNASEDIVRLLLERGAYSAGAEPR